jgi:sulfate adenylyltransferase
MPITLPADPDVARPGVRLALRDPHNELIALLSVEEAYPWNAEREAVALLGKADPRHPLVAEMGGWGKCYVSGPLRVLRLPRAGAFRELRLTPREVRARLAALGHERVVAFQTRNPMHRSHEELTKRAARQVGGALLLHPTVGLTKPGDVDQFTRVRSYRLLFDAYYDKSRTLLALLPLAMRMAGPKEALWHALVRRNYGASHFIVGRDHAGPGPDSSGKPFFAPYDAQALVARHAAEIGIEPLPFQELVYLPEQDRYEETDRVPPGVAVAQLSGTEVRERYLAKGTPLPGWFTRPETAALLAETHPPLHERGFCVWFTGLPSAGKSATADALTALLLERGRQVTLLDGDVVRTHLSQGLGFDRADRDRNVRRIGFVAAEVVRHRGVAVCAAVSPYRAAREECRQMIGADQFFEVYVDTPLELCEQRDAKGLYARARRGEVKGFTGVDDPYEPPLAAECVLTTHDVSAEQNARRVLALLVRRGFVRRSERGAPRSRQ